MSRDAQPAGLFVCQETLDIGLALEGTGGMAIRIALTPEEMRLLAGDLLAAADERERRAGDEASALLERVTGRMQ